MAIKKFGDSPEETPKAETGSKFDPFNEAPSPLGKKVYSATTGETEGRYTDTKDLIEALIGDATAAFETCEKLISLYEKATRTPTRANVIAWNDAVGEVVGKDNTQGKTVLGILISTLIGSFGPGKR